jgi:kynureninase
MRTDAEYARELDRDDELVRFRGEFVIDDPDLIYLDGNSLGRLPKATASRIRDVSQIEWGGRLIRGWNDGWFTAPQRIGAKIAGLIGARPDEVILADSTSVNLFKLVAAALQVRPDRRTIVTDDLNFPSDLYVLEGAVKLAGSDHRVKLAASPDGVSLPLERLADQLDANTALVALTQTAFKSGFTHDMAAVGDAARRVGAWTLWDLSHSVGAMPISLGSLGVELAVGCTYKYLNGGPGAPAFLFVRRDLQDKLLNPIRGWFGQRDQFDFALDYSPAGGMRRFQTGTPPIVSLSAVEPGVDLVLEAGVDRIRAKSIRQTEYLIGLWRDLLEPLGVTLNSPLDPARRGSHVSFGHGEGLRIARALIEVMHVIPDFRAPDNLRFGVAPLYTSFHELHEAVMRLRRVLIDRLYEQYPRDRPAVT